MPFRVCNGKAYHADGKCNNATRMHKEKSRSNFFKHAMPIWRSLLAFSSGRHHLGTFSWRGLAAMTKAPFTPSALPDYLVHEHAFVSLKSLMLYLD